MKVKISVNEREVASADVFVGKLDNFVWGEDNYPVPTSKFIPLITEAIFDGEPEAPHSQGEVEIEGKTYEWLIDLEL